MTINNNNIFGAFTLGEVRSGRLTGDWLNKETVANYGWWGGGVQPGSGVISTVERIDFSNDSITTQSRGSLSSAKANLAATGNSNYGWFNGGIYVTTVDRIDFSNDSATASVRGSLSIIRGRFGSVGNSNYGWFGGGIIPTPAIVSTVERIDFSNDSGTASLRGPLSLAKWGSSATGNSNYGWFAGAQVGLPQTNIDRIDFSNDFSIASIRGPLTAATYLTGATGNSNYGWWAGGWDQSSSPIGYSTKVNRLDFSNDTQATSSRGPLSVKRGYLGATGNSNYGWFGGGWSPGLVSTVDRIDFSNDTTTASPRGALSAARGYQGSASGVLNIRRQKAGNFGWFGGGTTPGGVAFYSTVERIDFSNDSIAASVRGAVLNEQKFRLAAVGNSNYGWFGGGQNPATGNPLSNIDRIDFSNDSAASSRGTFRLGAAPSTGATGNSNYGWIAVSPGFPNPSAVHRIDFSNDSGTVSVRGPLFTARSLVAATGNSNYGWFGGGFPSLTTVDRIDFSSDLATASPRSPLSISNGTEISATGNSNYGWFGSFTLNRIDFSNDSVSASVRGSLSQSRYRPAATGNSNYGWWGGGYTTTPAAAVSTIDRINFSNDLAAASVRGSLSVVKQELAATSNTTR